MEDYPTVVDNEPFGVFKTFITRHCSVTNSELETLALMVKGVPGFFPITARLITGNAFGRSLIKKYDGQL